MTATPSSPSRQRQGSAPGPAAALDPDSCPDVSETHNQIATKETSPVLQETANIDPVTPSVVAHVSPDGKTAVESQPVTKPALAPALQAAETETDSPQVCIPRH